MNLKRNSLPVFLSQLTSVPSVEADVSYQLAVYREQKEQYGKYLII